MMSSRCLLGTLLVCAASQALGGCGGNDRLGALPASTYDPTSAARSDGGADASTRDVSAVPPRATPEGDPWTGAARLSGALGGVVSFNGPDAVAAGHTEMAQSTVRIDADDPAARWWVMIQLTVIGTLRHPALVPGAHLVFDAHGAWAAPAGSAPLTLNAYACSGPQRDNVAFDHVADEVILDVSAGPTAGTQRVDFTAAFVSMGTQRITGSFVYDTAAIP